MPETGAGRPTLRDLQRRLEALEKAVLPASGERTDTSSSEGDEGDPRWALHGLQERLPPPGGVLWAGFFTGADAVPVEQQYAASAADQLDQSWAPLADRLQALGHPVRLELLRAVLSGRCSTAELLDVLGAGSTGQLYHHLTQLTGAGWVRPAGRGRFEVPPTRRVALMAVIASSR